MRSVGLFHGEFGIVLKDRCSLDGVGSLDVGGSHEHVVGVSDGVAGQLVSRHFLNLFVESGALLIGKYGTGIGPFGSQFVGDCQVHAPDSVEHAVDDIVRIAVGAVAV